jgi:ribosomal protein L11 methylase PrmA
MNLLIIPFTYHWIMKKAIGSPKTLLDLGCGNGDFSYDLFKNDKFQITGVDSSHW